MAGSNKIYKQGQLVFKAGDKSDGMYLVRRGEVMVYLEQEANEVLLANIGEGGMVGEMALFDHQPRSASVKATKESELTLISNEDFAKLMKQIPKWFVGLMTALSTRLRQTNERLKNLEGSIGSMGMGPPPSSASPPQKPYHAVIRILNILNLLWAKDGVKEGKDWLLPKLATETQLSEIFGEDPTKVKRLFELFVQEKIFLTRPDQYKNVALVLPNRGILSSIANFMASFGKVSPQKPSLSDSQLTMIKALERMVVSSPYDTVTVALSDLQKEGAKDGANTKSWGEDIKVFALAGDEVKLVKASNGPGLRTNKKDVAHALKHHEVLVAVTKAKLV